MSQSTQRFQTLDFIVEYLSRYVGRIFVDAIEYKHFNAFIRNFI